jgi:hypothetical protein
MHLNRKHNQPNITHSTFTQTYLTPRPITTILKLRTPHTTRKHTIVTTHSPTSTKITRWAAFLNKHKAHNTLRIYFQNVNGISTNSWCNWQDAAMNISTLQIDICGIAETNIAWTEPTRKHAEITLRKHARQANMNTCSSIEVGCNEYQPGGAVSCVTGRWTGRILERLSDTSGLGPWTGHVLAGKNKQHVAVITAYCPPKSTGFNTAYQQQWRILRKREDPNSKPRETLLKDLQQYILSLTSQECEVVLMWDANENISTPRSKLINFMTTTDLSPVHSTLATNRIFRPRLTVHRLHYVYPQRKRSRYPVRIPNLLQWRMDVGSPGLIHRHLDNIVVLWHTTRNHVNTQKAHHQQQKKPGYQIHNSPRSL